MADITKPHFCYDAQGMDLESTLFCGQSFSWKKTNQNEFLGVATTHAVLLRQVEDKILAAPLTPVDTDGSYWKEYLDLNTDYASIQHALCQNEHLARCVAAAPGIRVLRQPFWDTLLSFIISQNNHIARIGGIVERLREGFGPQLDEGVYGFPAPEVLAAQTPESLAPLRAGFRAKYLIDAARKVAGGEVREPALRVLPDDEARRLLCTIHGVGPKVADCVLLFGLSRTGVAPMDVWMKRACGALFGGGMPPESAGMEGIAQQYLFSWARDNLPRGK